MRELIDILFWVAAGYVLALAARRYDWPSRLRELRSSLFTPAITGGVAPTAVGASLPAAAIEDAAQAPAPAANEDEGADQALGARLHRLESLIHEFASDSSHPREIAEHRDFLTAKGLLADPAVPVDTVLLYALGTKWVLSCAALAALAERDDRDAVGDQIAAHLERLPLWPIAFALELFLRLNPRLPAGAPLLRMKEGWRESSIMIVIFRDYLDRLDKLGEAPIFGPGLGSGCPIPLIRSFLEAIRHPFADELVTELDQVEPPSLPAANTGYLAGFGRFWKHDDQGDILVEPERWKNTLATLRATLREGRGRPLLVMGEPLVGKSSLLKLLAQRIEPDGWRVFEASGADLMAGQQWFGQLEERVRRTVEEVAVGKKLIWYIPDIMQLARSGTHQGQSASILDQIMPAISSGRLIVWTEATPAGAARLFQLRSTLRSMVEMVAVEPMPEDEALDLAEALAERQSREREVSLAPGCAAVALAAARQYLSGSSLPGSALKLIKLTIARGEKGKRRTITGHHVLETLSQLTGLPVSILDHQERLDLSVIREFFVSRVIGQDEAVNALIERIAMLKAGLSDPGKPIGVLLFAGPTGTGKTELAKTAAEFLFGGDDRMIRLDMSEFQSQESVVKLLGEPNAQIETDSLIARVRKQPFSVVLLDEFEKSHPRIWDLFLQVFDDGRLSDATGHVADFRHCIIIMTSNLGATSHQTSGFGFAPGEAAFSADQIMRAMSQTYRPEFLNRLDKVIVFRPLTRDLMRGILKKELDGVVERRGLKDRTWAVEWEASALEFLLEKGFSPEMGARPLKRAIDQFVLAPLAATIVERRFPEGDQFVFVRSDGRAIKAEFVDPDSDHRGAPALLEPDAARPLPALSLMVLAPEGTRREFDALGAALRATEEKLASAEWEDLKAGFAERMSAPDFWQNAGRHEPLARLALMDRVAAAAGTAASLQGRLARAEGRPGAYSRELIARLALQVYLVDDGIRDVFEKAPIEVALWVEPALEGGSGEGHAGREWCRELIGMYRSWAASRHMQVEELALRGGRDEPVLLVSGFGAHRTLAREAGLHLHELGEGAAGAGRAAARVSLIVPPLGDVPAAKMREVIVQAMQRHPRSNAVVRRYRREPSPLVRNANGSWRTGRLDAVLGGDFDLLAPG